MSPRIHQLPEELISRIAAGEVVERPASLVKELIENSLDAGSTHISLQVEGAGRTRISIADDGCGMTRDEAKLALKRHCTSKIFALEDLETIETFGFRGEALPSIASVSRLTLTTRSQEEDSGWQMVLEGGKVKSERPTAREPGTTIEVRDLFYNTPARFKFLKADGTERAQIMRVAEEMIFSSPDVTFRLEFESAKPQVFPPSDLRKRIVAAWSGRWDKGLVEVNSSSPHFKIHGYVTNPNHHQASVRHQFFYINRRPVQNRRLSRAIYDAFTGQLPSLRHPGWVLFLEVDPRNVDVNVHPSKREVKLTHESEIFGFVLQSVKNALSGSSQAPTPMFAQHLESSSGFGWKIGTAQHAGSRSQFPNPTPTSPSTEWDWGAGRGIGEATRRVETSQEPSQPPEQRILLDPSLRVVAQVKNTFIVAETETEFLLIDQHAAAEKAAYEKIMRDYKEQHPHIQMLLVPFTWETAMSVAPSVNEGIPTLTKMGFIIEPFGGTTFLIKGVPAHLGDKYDLATLLDGLSDVLGETAGLANPRAGIENNREHKLAAMTACKASVRAGDRLNIQECEKIVKDLSHCTAPQTCPHGRPTVVRISYDELLRRFRRT